VPVVPILALKVLPRGNNERLDEFSSLQASNHSFAMENVTNRLASQSMTVSPAAISRAVDHICRVYFECRRPQIQRIGSQRRGDAEQKLVTASADPCLVHLLLTRI
jgi:hypothetical protein